MGRLEFPGHLVDRKTQVKSYGLGSQKRPRRLKRHVRVSRIIQVALALVGNGQLHKILLGALLRLERQILRVAWRNKRK